MRFTFLTWKRFRGNLSNILVFQLIILMHLRVFRSQSYVFVRKSFYQRFQTFLLWKQKTLRTYTPSQFENIHKILQLIIKYKFLNQLNQSTFPKKKKTHFKLCHIHLKHIIENILIFYFLNIKMWEACCFSITRFLRSLTYFLVT